MNRLPAANKEFSVMLASEYILIDIPLATAGIQPIIFYK